MQKTLKSAQDDIEVAAAKRVCLCVQSRLYELEGKWQWTLNSDAVYCSDVMEFPGDFTGAKGIIHPDDLPEVKIALERLPESASPDLSFRLITTYGEIKTIAGQNIYLKKPDLITADVEPLESDWEKVLRQLAEQKENSQLRLRRDLVAFSERMHGTGTWYINKDTNEMWYSDQVYRLYGLSPQSLNAHINTFSPYIHPEDRVAVTDAFDRAYEQEVPLHMTYRILTPTGDTRQVQLLTEWSFTPSGQHIFYGVIRDLTGEQELQDQITSAEAMNQLHQQILKFSEMQAATGYFVMNLVTHKTIFSDNYNRIFGIKQPMVPSSTAFLKFVHPEDSAHIQAQYEKMLREHVLEESEFRILRADGKQRWIRQSGKLYVFGQNELLIIGVVQDLTVKKGLESKIQHLNEQLQLKQLINELSEDIAEVSSIVWFPEGHMHWSDGVYKMLGYRPGAVEPLDRILYKSIHPEDGKSFRDAVAFVMNGQEHDDLECRIVSKAGIRWVNLSFRQVGDAQRPLVIGVLRDITGQKELEGELTGKTRFSDLLNNTVADIILLTDTDHTITIWNEAATTKTGIERKDALNKNLFDIFPSLQNENYLDQLHKVMGGSAVSQKGIRSHYINQPHNYTLSPLKDADDNVIGILHLVQDTSKEQDLQQRLNERLNFIENLVESSVDRIVVLDRHMNYLYWNRKAEEYYAIKKERVLGKNILEIFPGFRNDPSYNEFRRVLKGETVHIPPEQDENSSEYFETYLTPIKDDEGNITAVLWIIHDLGKEMEVQRVQRETQKQLAEEHRRLKEAQAIGHVGSFTWEMGSNISHWSDELYRINGLEPQSEEITLETVDRFIHPDDFKELQCLKETSFRQAGEYKIIHRIVLRSGEVRWVNHQWESIADESGRMVRVSGIVQDITEKKVAEEEFTQRKQLLQATMDSSRDMIQVFEAVRDEKGEIVDFRYILLNHEAEKWMGDVVGERLLQQQPGVVEEGIFDAFRNVVDTGVPQQYEKHYVHEQFNGWFHQSVVKLGDGVATTTADITTRKNAEQKLKETLDLVQKVFDVSLNPIAYHKAVRDASGKIIDFEFQLENREARKYAAEDRRGKRYSDAYPGIKDTAVFRMYCDVVETGNILDKEVSLTLQGTERWFHLMGVKLGDGLVATALDITERKNAEDEIFQLKDEIAQKATDRYYSLFNTIDEGLSVLELIYDDRGKPVDMRWIEVNPAFEKITGLKNVAGRLCSEFVPSEQYWLDTYDRVLKTGESIRYENYHAGINQWYRTHTSRIGGPGSRIVANVFEDITERKHWEANQAFLLRFSDQLRLELTVDAVANCALQMLIEQLGLDRSFITTNYLGENRADLNYQIGNESVPPLPNYFILSEFPETLKATFEGTFVIEDDWERQGVSEDEKRNSYNLGMRAMVAATLHKDENKPLWSMVAVSSRPRHWTPAEIKLVEDVAERTWAAIERAKAEDALRKSEERLTALNEHLEQEIVARTKDLTNSNEQLKKQYAILQHTEGLAQIGSWEYDPGSGAFSWSDGMYRLFGLLIGTKVTPEVYLEAAVEEDRSIAKRIIKNIKKAKLEAEEIIRIRRGEEVRLLKIKGSAVANEGGEPQKVIGVDVDITDIIQAEEELQESRHWLQQTALTSPDSITIYDIRNKQPVYLNDCLAHWLGTTSEELVAMGIEGRLSVVHPDDRLRLLHFNELTTMAKDEAIQRMEYRIRTKTDKVIWLRNRSKVFQRDKEGKATHILSILEDVTAEKEAESKLLELNASLEQKNKVLENKNEEITSFAFIASHDLKEPLRKMYTFSDWLLQQERPHLSDKGRKYLERMAETVKRMDLLIEDVLVLAKINSDKNRIGTIELQEVLQKVISELPQKDIDVHTPEIMPSLQGNPNQLYYLFHNLLENAIKFQAPGNVPQVDIQCQKVKGSQVDHNDAIAGKLYLQVAIQDNGIGFDEKYTSKIFNVFQRLHHETEYQGTGIGLAICRKIMENHNGFITAKSKKGEGATFYCYFPIVS